MLIIGDSFLEAFQVEYEQSIPGLIEKRLSHQLGTQIGVRNTAVSAWGPNHYRLQVEQWLEQETVDAVLVFVYLGNDLMAFVAGLMDAAIFSFLPIYGLRIGLAEHSAITLLSLFLIGSLLFQLPIGWLADKLNRRTVLTVCAGVGAVGPIVFALLADQLLLAALPLLIWGGAVWSLYSIALAMLGDRYDGATLVTANAAFVIAFELANIVSPPLAGGALEIWHPHGLIVFMAAAGAVYFVIVVARGLTKRSR